MTPIVVVRSVQSACQVCDDGQVSMHFPGPYVDLGIVQTGCLHCGPAALPVLVLPAHKDQRKIA